MRAFVPPDGKVGFLLLQTYRSVDIICCCCASNDRDLRMAEIRKDLVLALSSFQWTWDPHFICEGD